MRAIASLHSNLMTASAPSPAQDTGHSPVPYLFGGLAAMLGLIACALLILACSYWRLSGHGRGGGDSSVNNSDDIHRGGYGKQAESNVRPPPNFFGEGFVVIMAGDEKPTFLATPISTKSWGTCGDGGESTAKDEMKEDGEIVLAGD